MHGQRSNLAFIDSFASKTLSVQLSSEPMKVPSSLFNSVSELLEFQNNSAFAASCSAEEYMHCDKEFAEGTSLGTLFLLTDNPKTSTPSDVRFLGAFLAKGYDLCAKYTE